MTAIISISLIILAISSIISTILSLKNKVLEKNIEVIMQNEKNLLQQIEMERKDFQRAKDKYFKDRRTLEKEIVRLRRLISDT